MKNRKQKILLLLIVVLNLLIPNLIFAQKFYGDVKLGYGFPFLSKDVVTEYVNDEFTQDGSLSRTTVQKNKKLSYGKGGGIVVNVGYMINPYIGVDLGIAYKHGGKTLIPSSSYRMSSNSYYEDEVNQYYSRSSQFSISVVLTPGFKQWNPYIKMGLLGHYGSFSNISNRSYYEEQEDKEILEITKFKGVKGFGFQTTVGVSYALKEYLSVFAELNMDVLTCAADQSEVVKYDIYYPNGEIANGLESMSNHYKYTKYVDKLTTDFINPPSPNEARLALKTKFPFSSIGINLGVKFRF